MQPATKLPQYVTHSNNIIMRTIRILIIILFASYNIFAQQEYHEYFCALVASENSQYEKAIEHYNNIAPLCPPIGGDLKTHQRTFVSPFWGDKGGLFVERGNIYYKLGKYDNAISDFKNAEKINSKKGLLEAAKCYSLKNDVDSSILYLKKYLNQFDKIPKSEIKLDKAFENIKNTEKWQNLWNKEWYSNVEIKINRAIYLKNQEKYIEALDELNAVLRKNKNNHKAYFIKGEIFYAVKNYKDAIKNYSKAVKIKSTHTPYILARAKSYSKAKKYKKANKDYNTAIQQNPKNIQIYYKRALILNKLKKYDEAKSDITIYIKYFNNDSEVFYNCGLIYYNSEDYLGSLKYFNTAIEKNNTIAKYYYARANAYSKTRTYDYAIKDYNVALDINPKLTDIYLQMGITKLEQGDTESACMFWQKSIKNKDYRANNYILKHCK